MKEQSLEKDRSNQANIHPEWMEVLEDEFQKPYMKELKKFLLEEKRAGKTIFPPGKEIFTAYNLSPFSKVKVVVLGQDPYHGDNQAHGLSFSVRPGVPVPPSLVNIYKELAYDLNLQNPGHGYLKSWSEQGVLLLNNVLTVEKGKAASHQKKGWEKFTDATIEVLNAKREKLVFILWGSQAQKKGAKIDREKHLVLSSVHPSPLSSYRGFFGSRPFSQTNRYLIENKVKPVNWQLDQLPT